jgi:hypothetical protein
MTIRALTAAVALVVLASPIVTHAQNPGPIRRAMHAEAARLAAEATANPSPRDQQQAGLSVWLRVAELDAGSEIVLVRSNMPSATYRLLSVQDDALTILDVSSPVVPSDVARELQREAQHNPVHLIDARRGEEFALSKNVRFGPSGVSQAGRHLFPLTLVVVDVPRDEVDELSVIKKHVGAHARRGVIIGAILGSTVVAGACAAASGCSVGDGLGGAALGGLLGGILGLEYGTIVGLIWPRTAELVYRR